MFGVENFGAIDADNDELLQECFENHEAFLDIVQLRRFLVIGRKGSGKTAIFKKLTNPSASHFSVGYTFSDYPWQQHDQQARVGIPDADRYTHSWKYLILLAAAKVALNKDKSLPHDELSLESLTTLERFIVESYGSRDPAVHQLFAPSRHLRLSPHFEIDWSMLRPSISPERVPIGDLPRIVQEVNENLQRCVINSLNPENKYFICFDQLDLGFNPATPEYNSRLIGLLLACRDLNIAAKQAGKKLWTVVFLRDDIYNTLQFEDKNKITENFLSNIEWDTPRTKHTLKKLMERRFEAVLGAADGELVAWEEVFDEVREMPGRQKKYKHIIDRTYLRPRDIIRFCNTVLEKHKDRWRGRAAASMSTKFENADLHDARADYSDYLLRELEDEVHKHIPGYKNHLELLRSIGVWQFSKKQFDDICAKLSEFAGDLSSTSILQQLYEFSIVGFYRTGGKGYGGSEYVFKYKDPRARFDTTSQRFRVHPGLIETLALKMVALPGDDESSEYGPNIEDSNIAASNPKTSAHPGVIAESAAAMRVAPVSQTVTVADPTSLPPTVAAANLDGVNIVSVATEWESRHGGLSTFNRDLCCALVKAGNRVVCVVPEIHDGEYEKAEAVGVKLVSPTSQPGLVGTEVLLLDQPMPQGFTPDLILGHDRKTGPYAAALSKRFPNARLLHFIHTRSEDIEWHKDKFGEDDAAIKAEERRTLQQKLAADASLVVGVGPALSRAAASLVYLASPRPQLHRLDPGFQPIGRPADLPPEIECLVLGRAEDLTLKGLDIAVRALSGVAKRKKVPMPPRLIVRGAPKGTGGTLRRTLVGIAEERIDIEVREYTPDVKALQSDIRQSSVLLMPSRSEGFGLVGLEAIAASTPVLVSDRSGLGELLRERLGKDAEAIVVKTDEELDVAAHEWERHIEAVLMDRKAAFERAAALRQRLLEMLSWDDAVRKLKNAWKPLVAPAAEMKG
ncbi:glycosyltransferase family 4 protein [Sorangium sp. So ce291]|uniref:glycosyltransferase family 4 protein n=1 Tax=Sorangium sp. So ce291 TaxID=3133294 RepID=UPI003F63C15F